MVVELVFGGSRKDRYRSMVVLVHSIPHWRSVERDVVTYILYVKNDYGGIPERYLSLNYGAVLKMFSL